MAHLYSQIIKNIVSGISQQPAILRLPEQLEGQVNGFSTEVGGLQKRPPTIHVANLFTNTETHYTPLVHVVKRDEDEKYIMIFSYGSLRVYDEDGTEYKVTMDKEAQDYIDHVNPRKHLRVITIADYTFIVNTSRKVQMADTEYDAHRWNGEQGALFNVKSGQYGRTYSCIINGDIVATFETPDGSKAEHAKVIDVNNIANKLAEDAKTKEAEKGWKTIVGDSWVYFYKESSSTPITSVESRDGFNGQAMIGIYKSIQNFNNLPRNAPDGFTVQVKGTSDTSDDYYVRYNKDKQLWEECAKPGTKTSFDKNTMPHALIREKDFSFTLKALDWADREVGDEDSNPEPSFVGDTINDIFFYRNRLGLISGENVILSMSADFFNFWFASVVEMQDTDPIDIAVSHNTVAILRHAVPFNEELLLFSDSTQFVLKSEGILSPKNCTLSETTEFACNPYVRPVGAGRRVYFPIERAEYTTIREYYTMEDTLGLRDAQDITSHVPSYIKNGVYCTLSSNTENVLLFLSEGAEDTIYVYKYLFIDSTRLQSSWSHWTFNHSRVLGGGFINSTLYLVLERNNNQVTLESLSFTYNTKDFENYEPYRVYLDRKVILPKIDKSAYDKEKDETQINITQIYGDSINPKVQYGVVDKTGFFRYYNIAELKDGKFVYIHGNLVGENLIVGELYEFKATFSEVMIRKDDGGDKGTTAYPEGRLQLRNFWINYEQSGYFKVCIISKDKDSYEYEMTARILGSTQNRIGEMSLETGQFKFPVQSLSTNCKIQVVTKMPLPIALIGAGWEGVYYRRSTRI